MHGSGFRHIGCKQPHRHLSPNFSRDPALSPGKAFLPKGADTLFQSVVSLSCIFVHCLFSFSVCWLNKHLLSPTCVSGCVRTEFIEGMWSSAWLGPTVWASKEGSARKEHQNFSGTPHPSRFVARWPEPQIMAACPHTHTHTHTQTLIPSGAPGTI